MLLKTTSKLILASMISLVSVTSIAGSNSAKIKISADKTQLASNNQDGFLNGHVQINIGTTIKISADKVLVKYKHKEVAEFITYSKGSLEQNNHTTQFVNGVFSPKETQLTAEQIIS